MNKSLDYGNAAPRLLENGYEAIPIIPGTKRPAIELALATGKLNELGSADRCEACRMAKQHGPASLESGHGQLAL